MSNHLPHAAFFSSVSDRKSKLQNTQLHSLILATKEKEFYHLTNLGVKSIEDSWKEIAEDIKNQVLFVTLNVNLYYLKSKLILNKTYFIYFERPTAHLFSIV